MCTNAWGWLPLLNKKPVNLRLLEAISLFQQSMAVCQFDLLLAVCKRGRDMYNDEDGWCRESSLGHFICGGTDQALFDAWGTSDCCCWLWVGLSSHYFVPCSLVTSTVRVFSLPLQAFDSVALLHSLPSFFCSESISGNPRSSQQTSVTNLLLCWPNECSSMTNPVSLGPSPLVSPSQSHRIGVWQHLFLWRGVQIYVFLTSILHWLNSSLVFFLSHLFGDSQSWTASFLPSLFLGSPGAHLGIVHKDIINY